jgi:hypothetical protein
MAGENLPRGFRPAGGWKDIPFKCFAKLPFGNRSSNASTSAKDLHPAVALSSRTSSSERVGRNHAPPRVFAGKLFHFFAAAKASTVNAAGNVNISVRHGESKVIASNREPRRLKFASML